MAPRPQIVYRIVNKPCLEMCRLPHESAGCDDLIDEEPRLIGGEFEPFLFCDPLHDGVE